MSSFTSAYVFRSLFCLNASAACVLNEGPVTSLPIGLVRSSCQSSVTTLYEIAFKSNFNLHVSLV